MNWLDHAIARINEVYGDRCDPISEIPKDLLKFGRNENVGTSSATVMDLPGSELHETFVSTNAIDSISSSDNGDTVECVVEGHTVDGNGDFTFVIQAVTLTGQTRAALTTPLARATRFYNNNGTDLAGTVYVYENDTLTAGVPQTDTKVHMIIPAGYNQSRKASTTISKDQYWLINNIYLDVLDKTAAFAIGTLELRQKGKVFRNRIDISASNSARGSHDFKPYFIVPKNADVRLTATADGASTDISGGMQGIILRVNNLS